ncbi:hypothetical protein ACH6CV_05800 [Bacillota bacterium Meth-B3]
MKKKSIGILLAVLAFLFGLSASAYAANAEYRFEMNNTGYDFNASTIPCYVTKAASNGRWGINLVTWKVAKKGEGTRFRNVKYSMNGSATVAGEGWVKKAGKTSFSYISGEGVRGLTYEPRARIDSDYHYNQVITGYFTPDA